MKVILVDDEQYSLVGLKNMLLRVENIEVVGTYTDPEKALNEIDETKPHGALLDIEMPGMNGLELGEKLLNENPDIEIIYVTAYSEYALDAFEISAIDYLLKPVNEKRLKNALKRLESRLLRSQLDPKSRTSNKLKVKAFSGFEVYDLDGNPIRWRTSKAKELFVYLWTKEGQFVNRDLIIEEIFPDRTADRGIALLHTTIYQIRNSLRQAGFEKVIDYSNESYRLAVETDSEAKKVRQIVKKGDIEDKDVDLIIKTCQGEFMEEDYPWVTGLKHVYEGQTASAVEKYINKKIDKNEIATSLEILVKLLLKVDPYSESAAELMIKIYGMQEKRREVKLFHEKYKVLMKDEMGVKPSEKLEKLVEKYS